MQKIRVRFAPSPTGNLHVGGARTALFNWLFARNQGGTFILRIEDTDQERSSEAYTKAILDGLSWLGLDWDEGPGVGGPFGPYFQTQRSDLYQKAIQTLIDSGKAYHCFCSPEELEKMREEQAAAKQQIKYNGKCRGLAKAETQARISAGERFVIRLSVPENASVSWEDLVKGPMTFASDLLDDLVISRSDGFPTYNLAVVVDDSHMEITHVIRGEDHISNTPKQILLYQALNKPTPRFAHIPLMLGADKSRLSKRHGATSIIEYQNMGLAPEAFRNYLALQGWSPGAGREVLSLDEMKKEFSLTQVSTHGAVFNLDKLYWMNTEYLKRMTSEDLLERLRPWLEKIPGFPGPYDAPRLARMGGMYRERIKVFPEITAAADWFFRAPEIFEEKGLQKVKAMPGVDGLLTDLITAVGGLAEFADQPLEQAMRGFAEASGRKFGEIVSVLRLALSGRTATPGMFEVMAVLGKEACLARLQTFRTALA